MGKLRRFSGLHLTELAAKVPNPLSHTQHTNAEIHNPRHYSASVLLPAVELLQFIDLEDNTSGWGYGRLCIHRLVLLMLRSAPSASGIAIRDIQYREPRNTVPRNSTVSVQTAAYHRKIPGLDLRYVGHE